MDMDLDSQRQGPACAASGSNPPAEGRSKAIERRLNSIASTNIFQALTAELARQDAEKEAKRQAKAEAARKQREERAAATAAMKAVEREERRREADARKARREAEAQQKKQAREEKKRLKAQLNEQERERKHRERQAKNALTKSTAKPQQKPVKKSPLKPRPENSPAGGTVEQNKPTLNLPALLALSRQHEDKTIYPKRPFDRRVNPGNPRWAGYRPRWLREAEKSVAIHPTDFHYYREYVHCMSQAQCAAFLRVQAATVARWEAGLEPIPYSAYIALRLVADLEYLPHQVKEWASWRQKTIASGECSTRTPSPKN